MYSPIFGLDEDRNWTTADLSRVKASNLVGSIVYLVLLTIIGVVGNLLVLYIFYFRFGISTHRCFILTLASYDLLACVFGAPWAIAESFFAFNYHDVVSCKLFRFVLYYTCIASSLTLVLIAVERHRKICAPLKTQFTIPMAKKATCVVVFGVSTISAMPALILYGNHSVPTGFKNVTGTKCFITDHFSQTEWPRYFNIYLLVLAFVSTVIMAVSYVRIARTVSQMGNLQIQKRIQRVDSERSRSAMKSDNSVEKTEDEKCASNSTARTDDSKARTNGSKARTDGGKARTDDSKARTDDSEARTDDSEARTDDSKARTDDSKARTDDSKARSDDNEARAGDSKARTDDSKAISLKRQNGSADDASKIKHCEGAKQSVVSSSSNGSSKSNNMIVTKNAVGARPSVISSASSNSSVKSRLRIRERASKYASRVKKSLSMTSLTSSNQKTLRITKMLTAVTVVFVISYLPHLSLMIWSACTDEPEEESLPTDNLYQILFYSFLINNLVNPFIYATMDAKFKAEIKKIVKCE